jgi:hypothetical protein
MSHFTKLKTKLVERLHLVRALRDLGHEPREDTAVQGWMGIRKSADVVFTPKAGSFDVGFIKIPDGTHDMVADWMGVRGISRGPFLEKLTQRYAYHATVAKLEEQGFALASEENEDGGRIHLTLRRMV